MLYEIKHRFDGSVLFSLETTSLKLCVEAAVRADANLAGAYLARANLARADLASAYLAGANLAGAKDVIDAGCPHGYSFVGWHKDGVLMIRGGCHSFTIHEAREYWTGKKDRLEAVAALDYIERVAELRGWPLKKAEAA